MKSFTATNGFRSINGAVWRGACVNETKSILEPDLARCSGRCRSRKSSLDAAGGTYPAIIVRYILLSSSRSGISRTLAAVVEQNHDESGIIWPISIAPFSIHLITISMKDELQTALSAKLYKELVSAGLDVLWDDRDERPGVKFNDSDLLGFPVRLTVGKKASESIVECKTRKTGVTNELHTEQLINWIHEYLNKEASSYERSAQ